MALSQKTSYNNLSGAIQPMAAAAIRIGQSLPKQKPQQQPQAAPTGMPQSRISPKAFDTSKYGGLSKQVALKYGSSVPNVGTVSVPYEGSTKFEKVHPGIDIGNKIGTPLYSTVGGTVTGIMSGKKQGDKGYGNYVLVKDADGNLHRYSHLNQAYVKAGDTLKRGQLYGTMGNTGSTYSNSGGTGSHLDYRVVDMYNKYINPTRFLN